MSYPLEFSSTLTYANRYDLDEIDVFLEGNSNNPMFFNVDGLPDNLAFGKHYFNLSILDSTHQQYMLKPESKILFEFKSKNNVVLRSDVTDRITRNGVIICFVEVLKDPLRTFDEVYDGEGTLTIVGSLINKENTENLIPEKFIDAMNYRCTFPINIRKNLINANSPFQTNISHKRTTIQGQFSFVKNNISSQRGAPSGNTYNPNTGNPETEVSAGPSAGEGTD
tara:strand:+ start:311 stop:982 length:672 start_codon:yes stop_codon:yes gene_type:complete